MTITTPSDALAPQPAVNSGQRILPEGSRFRWEQQWLRQNREAVRVIANTPEQSASAPPAPGVAPNPLAPHTDAGTPAPLRSLSPVDANVASPTLAPPSDRAVIALYRSSAEPTPAAATLPIPPVPRANARAPLAEAAVTAETRALPAPANPTDPKRFGLWLEGNDVTLSLRQGPAEAELAPTLNSLRQWLRGLGLSLRTVIVNGAEHWRRPSGE